MASTEINQDDKKSARAKRHQVEVYFEHQGREITLVFSLVSGHEQVFVDNQPVAQSRNWRFKSVHAFDAGGVNYALEVTIKKNLKSIFCGIVDVQLLANGAVVDSDQFNTSRYLVGTGKGHQPFTWKRVLIWLLPFFAGGVVAGFALGHFGLKHFF